MKIFTAINFFAIMPIHSKKCLRECVVDTLVVSCHASPSSMFLFKSLICILSSNDDHDGDKRLLCYVLVKFHQNIQEYQATKHIQFSKKNEI